MAIEMLPIQKGWPIPPISRAPKEARRRYPIHKMVVGDMVFVPGKTSKAMSAYIARETAKMDAKFSVRAEWARKSDGKLWEPCQPGDKGAVAGCGIWRVE